MSLGLSIRTKSTVHLTFAHSMKTEHAHKVHNATYKCMPLGLSIRTKSTVHLTNAYSMKAQQRTKCTMQHISVYAIKNNGVFLNQFLIVPNWDLRVWKGKSVSKPLPNCSEFSQLLLECSEQFQLFCHKNRINVPD